MDYFENQLLLKPVKLVRDIKRFGEHGYALKGVTPFDLFPQTQHIESIALLCRDAE